MHNLKKKDFLNVVIAVVMIFVISGCTGEQKNESNLASQNAEQDKKIAELQNEIDEQKRLEEDRIRQEEDENKRIEQERLQKEEQERITNCESKKTECVTTIAKLQENLNRLEKDLKKAKEKYEDEKDLKDEHADEGWDDQGVKGAKANLESCEKQLSEAQLKYEATKLKCATYKSCQVK